MADGRTMRDLLRERPASSLVGRDPELAALGSTLRPDGPLVMFVHGLGGMGKTTLLEAFAHEARAAGADVITLDCRRIEPTPHGFLEALGAGVAASGPDDVVHRLAERGDHVVLAIDTFEALRLADTWLRQELVPALPANTRVVIAGRHAPNPAWRASGAEGAPVRSILLRPLEPAACLRLVGELGLAGDQARRVCQLAGGHPLLLQVAGAAVAERPWLDLDEAAVPETIEAVTHLYLRGLDPRTRDAIDAASVVRRVNEPLLGAMLADEGPRDAYERLCDLPFVRQTPDGLAVHEALQPVLARALQSANPVAHREYRRAAWEHLRGELRGSTRSEAWRCTADMLYLIGNPVVREAFFPTRAQRHVVEPARADDAADVEEIARHHEPPTSASALGRWWTRSRRSFRVVRDEHGAVTGFSCMLELGDARPEWMEDDPVAAAWMRHLAVHPVADDEEVLLLPRWLTRSSGELPDDTQAAIWLDIKGAYTARRPHLRRLYTVVRDLHRWAPIVGPLGFRPLDPDDVGGPVELDGQPYHPVLLDFGPASVDGWLTALVAEEMGLHTGPALDADACTVDVGGDVVQLTPLEHGVLENLVRRNGRPASRVDLLREVWGTDYEGGSNVVAAVVHTLRDKLGEHAGLVETMRGVGYRYRSP